MNGSLDLLITALDYCTTTAAVAHFTASQLRDMEQLCNNMLAGRVAVVVGEKCSLEVLQTVPVGTNLTMFG